MKKRDKSFILWFKDIAISDISLVGGKNASLGEMYSKLQSSGVRVPNGFAVTAYAYRFFIEASGVDKYIKERMLNVNMSNMGELASAGGDVRDAIATAPLPKSLKDAICNAYAQLEKEYGKGVDTAVRSSATAEDLPDASFAGQQETFLNVSSIG